MQDFVFPTGNGPFLPVIFCMDVSGSMLHNIAAMQDGFRQFVRDVQSDEQANKVVRGAVITFESNVHVVQDFEAVSNWNLPVLQADGCTDLAGAVNKALEILNEKKREYQRDGVTYYQPWIVLFTDGAHYTGMKSTQEDATDVRNAANEVISLCKARKLVSFPIGIGDGVDWETLKSFSTEGIALSLKDTNSFAEFFKFFSMSASATARSNTDAGHQIDMEQLMRAFDVKR
ncbi:MAG: VWA domain-containing protein [Planctomycetaceae bacterium]|nr:VWA domain-containing protein [Planctomycetaceae bacterium]